MICALPQDLNQIKDDMRLKQAMKDADQKRKGL